MGLSSVLRIGLSGMSAAESVLRVVADNLANTQTNGFKQSSVRFSPQQPQTRSLGSAPTAGGGGTNPTQLGSGVQTSGVTRDFSQGTIAVTSNSLDLALQGHGFLIIEGQNGEQLFTRDGSLQLGGASELVTASGDRVLGFGVDENFELVDTELVPLKIRIGSSAASADGTAAVLTSFQVDNDGTIQGSFTDGVTRTLGQIRVARFANPGGLENVGGNRYAAGVNSGLPVESSPGDGGAASIASGAVELSNTDVGENLIALILAENQFRASRLVFETGEELLDVLTTLSRKE